MTKKLLPAFLVFLGFTGPAASTLVTAQAAGASEAPVSTGDSARRPNILLIISDDFGIDVTSGMYPGLIDALTEQYGPVGHNHPDYQGIAGTPASTPVLDRLASEGMVFTNTWAQPFCSPSRASILTGLFSASTRVLSYADALSQNHDSFVRKLKQEGGYSTAVFGKWHIAGLPGEPVDYPGMKPKEAGFDLFRGNLHAAISTYWDHDYQVQDDSTAPDTWRTETLPERSLPGIASTTYAPVVKVADTIDWITRQEEAAPDKPWFAWLAFNLSHATSIQQPSAMAVPNLDTLDAISAREMEACGGRFGTNETGNCSGEALMRAMTNSMDTIIGKLLETVGEIDADTYVIFVSDNGTPMYGRPQLDFIDNMYLSRSGRGKGTTYESGVRVGFSVRGPGIEAGSVSDDYVHVADLFSTILDLAGLEAPQLVADSQGRAQVPVDAVNLSPLMFGETQTVRDPDEGYLLAETLNLMTGGTREVGARNARYKLICRDGVDADACTFFDLVNDPLEEYPLAAPASCNADDTNLTTADPQWHYCRLSMLVATRSFFSNP